MDKTTTDMKHLKKGGFVIIEGVPCRVDSVQISTSGKHGHAKVRVEGIGLLDGTRRSIVKPSGETIDVPIVVKKKAQVLAILGNNKVQLMDLIDFSVMEMEVPEERRSEIVQGVEIDYFEVMDIKTLKQLK